MPVIQNYRIPTRFRHRDRNEPDGTAQSCWACMQCLRTWCIKSHDSGFLRIHDTVRPIFFVVQNFRILISTQSSRQHIRYGWQAIHGPRISRSAPPTANHFVQTNIRFGVQLLVIAICILDHSPFWSNGSSAVWHQDHITSSNTNSTCYLNWQQYRSRWISTGFRRPISSSQNLLAIFPFASDYFVS